MDSRPFNFEELKVISISNDVCRYTANLLFSNKFHAVCVACTGVKVGEFYEGNFEHECRERPFST